jgi:hypothetical protein
VCCFLDFSDCWIGFLPFKIINQKTNALSFNQMVWYFYEYDLLCSFVNWKPWIQYFSKQRVEPVFFIRLNFNDEVREENIFLENNLDDQAQKYSKTMK